MSNSCKGGNCGNKGCNFGTGKQLKSAFGKGADAFFGQGFTGAASIGTIIPCLQNGVYGKVPLLRFGSSKGKTSFGPMKIGSKKK